jgi:hypothetical protein
MIAALRYDSKDVKQKRKFVNDSHRKKNMATPRILFLAEKYLNRQFSGLKEQGRSNCTSV